MMPLPPRASDAGQEPGTPKDWRDHLDDLEDAIRDMRRATDAHAFGRAYLEASEHLAEAERLYMARIYALMGAE